MGVGVGVRVQYNVVLCLCHSVFASRDGITLTKQFEQRGWVATAKSWGRWTAQALVSRAFGRSLMTGVPISMAVQVRACVGVRVMRETCRASRFGLERSETKPSGWGERREQAELP